MPGAPRQDEGSAEAEFTGIVIVRLRDDIGNPALLQAKTLSQASDLATHPHLPAAGPRLRDVIEELQLDRNWRLIRSTTPERLFAMETAAQSSELPPLRSLTAYWAIDLRRREGKHDEEELQQVVGILSQAPEVDLAYAQVAAEDAFPINEACHSSTQLQDYLSAAPTGVDARHSWTQPGGDGQGVAIADIELGWLLDHEAYYSAQNPAMNPEKVHGDILGSRAGHGSAALGIMAARNTCRSILGIAPSASPLYCSSTYDRARGWRDDFADAIVAVILKAIDLGQPGMIVAIERQKLGLPLERDDDAFDAIRLACALGLVVVEAAGNSGNDLGAQEIGGQGDAHRIWGEGASGFRDSGAIVVGAARKLADDTLELIDGTGATCFGDRVNCFAIVQRPDAQGNPRDSAYTASSTTTTYGTFGLTSAATAIVAGAAACAQGLYRSSSGGRSLSSLRMRALLEQNGTAGPAGIGVMPDLARIANAVGGLSDLFVRDSLGDSGGSFDWVPFASPDVIVRANSVADPAAEFGEGSGTEDDASLGSEVTPGQDHHIYVRMRNQGTGAAAVATATVYYLASLQGLPLTAGDWGPPVGQTPAVSVPSGGSLTVAGPIVWPANLVGPGYLIVVLDTSDDPAPQLPIRLSPNEALDTSLFRLIAFVGGQTSVALRTVTTT